MMNEERLLRLANKLVGAGPYTKVGPVPLHKFGMASWWAESKGGMSIYLSEFKPTYCKTAACACGWAASDEWFKKRGIKTGFMGFSDFFGLDDGEFRGLFLLTAGACKTPRGVANAIRRMVANA